MPTAIEIFKHLPKKNCGECKNPTCLAFAMQLANNKAKLEDCPYVSDAGKAALAASSAPPIRLVRIGTGFKTAEVGDETELYRHDKKFFHPTKFVLDLRDDLDAETLTKKVIKANQLKFERVGQTMSLDLIGVRCVTSDAKGFADAVALVADHTEMPLVLYCEDPAIMRAAAAPIAKKRPLLHAANLSNHAEMVKLVKEISCPLAVVAEKGLNELADLVQTVRSAGVEDIVLDLNAADLKGQLERATIVRKTAVKKTFRGLGYPLFVRAYGEQAMLTAALATMKYGSIVALDSLPPERALPLFVLRQNIYTDPQVPIQVKPDLYPVNGPGENAPVLFTTNFSLTYFTVLADIEKSKVPVWLQVVDTEGLSVLTAFAAGKLTADGVKKALDKSGAFTRSKANLLVIPGMVARMTPKLTEVTGMKVVVGPKESSGLPKFLKTL